MDRSAPGPTAGAPSSIVTKTREGPRPQLPPLVTTGLKTREFLDTSGRTSNRLVQELGEVLDHEVHSLVRQEGTEPKLQGCDIHR